MPKVDEGNTMKLIRYRDAGMHTYTYFWADSNHRVISPYFDREEDAKEWAGDKLTALDDPKRIEFEEKREESLEEYRKQAMELWNDSCTSVRKNND